MTMNINRTFVAISLCILLIGVLLPLTALALAPDRLPPLPPLPTSTPTPTPTPPAPTIPASSPSQPVAGATIQLLVQPASEAVWQTYFWQDLWTVVQWKGFLGKWYDVEVEVGGGRIVVALDDEVIIDHKIDDHRFDVWPQQEPARPLGVTTYATKGAFRSFVVRRLEGQ